MKMKKENLNQINLKKILSLGYPLAEAKELINTSSNLKKDLKMLRKSYPIQYLIGYVSFFGYDIIINKNVLIPRHETEFLVEKALQIIKENYNGGIKVLEIGTGSGCISISLKKEIENLYIDAVDISKKALVVAKKNAILNNVKVNFFKSNLYSNIKSKYDVIISNPPYIDLEEKVDKSVKKYEPKKALYAKEKGLYFYRKIIEESKMHLNKKNLLLFEIGQSQANEISAIAKKIYINSKIIIEKDLSGKDRYLFIINE